MKKFIATIVLTIFSFLPVYAADWKEIQPKNYIDVTSITWKKDIVAFWMKLLNPGDWEAVNNKKVWYSKNYVLVDCKNKKIAFQSIIYYGLKEEVLVSYDIESEHLLDWHRVVPESNGDLWYQTFCQSK